MKFDIKDVKSWYNRHDVKVGDEGYFADEIEELKTEDNRTRMIAEILDDHAFCFRTPTNRYSFFLPLDAVKKEKKYRPFKRMRELTEIVYSKDWEYNNISVGDSLLIRRKGDEHYHQNILITSLEYDENDLISMNGKSMQEWLDNFEFLAHCEWHPFGAEIKVEEERQK